MVVGESCKLKEIWTSTHLTLQKLEITDQFEQVVHNVHIQSFNPIQFSPPFLVKLENR